jgi:serralysin
MSGTLTITYTEVPGGQTTVTRNQVGGTGEPDLTIVRNYATIGGHVAVSQTVIGGAGDDVLVGDPITYLIDGGAGNDTITNSGWLVGQAGDDLLRGGMSDDVLTGGPGDDTIDGGAGSDLVIYREAPQGVTVDLRIAGPQATGQGVDVLTGVEGLLDAGGAYAADTFTGDAQSNLLMGGGGDDVVYGLGGDDTITDGGFEGWDGYEPADATTRDYLRGGDGNDQISGGDHFDDLNGNEGNDTVHGDAGDDWVVGGKDHDMLFGDDAADLVYGNLGNDTGDGGAGNDVVRGGQGDDSLTGGAGNDWLSGDLGDDTLSGGAGADVFHSFGEAGIDRVTDFNPGEGDRVMLDPGDAYTVAQVGADTVMTLGASARMILVGVQLSTLSGDWIFTG